MFITTGEHIIYVMEDYDQDIVYSIIIKEKISESLGEYNVKPFTETDVVATGKVLKIVYINLAIVILYVDGTAIAIKDHYLKPSDPNKFVADDEKNYDPVLNRFFKGKHITDICGSNTGMVLATRDRILSVEYYNLSNHYESLETNNSSNLEIYEYKFCEDKLQIIKHCAYHRILVYNNNILYLLHKTTIIKLLEISNIIDIGINDNIAIILLNNGSYYVFNLREFDFNDSIPLKYHVTLSPNIIRISKNISSHGINSDNKLIMLLPTFTNYLFGLADVEIKNSYITNPSISNFNHITYENLEGNLYTNKFSSLPYIFHQIKSLDGSNLILPTKKLNIKSSLI